MDDVVVTLADCAEIVFGKNIDKAKTNSEGVGIPYIVGASDLKMGRYEPSRWCEATVKTPSYSEAGDLLISVVGTLGKMGVNTVGRIILSGHVCAIRPKSGVSRQYIMAMVSRLILEAIPDNDGVTLGFQNKLRPERLSAIRFALPDLILQEWLVARLTSIASIILAYNGKREDYQSCDRLAKIIDKERSDQRAHMRKVAESLERMKTLLENLPQDSETIEMINDAQSAITRLTKIY